MQTKTQWIESENRKQSNSKIFKDTGECSQYFCDKKFENVSNLKFSNFLPYVEASSRSIFNSSNDDKINQSNETTKNHVSAQNDHHNTVVNLNSRRFSSPFSTLSSPMDLLTKSTSCTINATSSGSHCSSIGLLGNSGKNLGTAATSTTATTKNPSSTTSSPIKEHQRQELLHHQDYFQDIWSSSLLNLHNNLITLQSVQPSIFQIKSVVNPSLSSSPNFIQQQRKSSLINTRTSNNSNSDINVTEPSSCQIDYSTTATTTTSTKTFPSATGPSSQSLLHPSSEYENNNQRKNSNIVINYNHDLNSDKIFSIDTATIADTTKKKFPLNYDEQFEKNDSFDYIYNSSSNGLLDETDQGQFHDQFHQSFRDPEEFDEEQREREESAYYNNVFSNPQFKHLTLADKRRFEKLFREIDVDGNGVIDFNDLLQALEQKGIQATHENVKHLILRSDVNLDGDIDFAEFVQYCMENEKQLRIIFKDIDVNDDGIIQTHELVMAFERAGIKVDEQEALRLVRRIKADSNSDTLELNYTEFRDYLLLHPTDSLQDLMRSWRFGTFVDMSEDGIMPVDFSENEIKSGMWWRHMLAGGVAGAVSRTSTAPLDRLKVFLQVRGAEFNGLGVCLRHMIQEGGVLSLWRGNGINVLKIAPETAMKFMAFDQLKRWIHTGDSTEITILERFLAGSLAGAVSQTAIYPMEVLKTRFCLRQTGQYRNIWDAAQKIYSNGGIKNFYRGYIPNLIGIIPYAGIDLTIYETLKKMYMTRHSLEEAPVYVCLTCGTVSSTFGQIASYPLALIRTRMQSETGHHRSSMVDMFTTILKREGPRGLYRGITANIMKVAPAVSISYVVYEYTRRPLGAIMS